MTGGDEGDTLNGCGGNDDFFYRAAGEAEGGEQINGGAGTDTIRFENAGANSFSFVTITDVEAIDFVSGNSTVTFKGDHFDSGEIVSVSGSSGVDALIVTTDDQLTGLVRIGTGSRDGKAVSFTGMTNGAWFGEGTVLKNEARRYDAVALRDTRLALMDRATFFWLLNNPCNSGMFG